MMRLSLGLLLAFALAACDESSTPAAPGGGTGGTFVPPLPGGGGNSGMGGAGSGGGGAGGESTGTGGTAGGAGMDGGMGGFGGLIIGDGACDNVDDVRALAALQPENGRSVAANCGVACADCPESDYVSRVTSCMTRDVPGLSDVCAFCYAEFAECLGLECNEQCAADSCSEDCQRERMCDGGNYTDCFDDLTACAGRNSTDCGDDT